MFTFLMTYRLLFIFLFQVDFQSGLFHILNVYLIAFIRRKGANLHFCQQTDTYMYTQIKYPIEVCVPHLDMQGKPETIVAIPKPNNLFALLPLGQKNDTSWGLTKADKKNNGT